ncbi:MAG: hypothetical protein KAX89_01120 [Propionivibrio sp.]|nr:hypothetical protein [Propionivibrio sp.]MBP8162155.1 hypothetical protein [Propionivibrio sp.]
MAPKAVVRRRCLPYREQTAGPVGDVFNLCGEQKAAWEAALGQQRASKSTQASAE